MHSKRLATFVRGAVGSHAAPATRVATGRVAVPASKVNASSKAFTNTFEAAKIQSKATSFRSYATTKTDLSLIDAAARGDAEELKKLLSSGSNVNASDYDMRTALHLAASEGHLEVVKFLLASGASINSADRFGNTALADALRSGKKAVARYLESQGAVRDLDVKLLRRTKEFGMAVQQALPLLAERGAWDYVEAWTPDQSGTKYLADDVYVNPAAASAFAAYQKETEDHSVAPEVIAAVTKTLKPHWIAKVSKAELGSRVDDATAAGALSGLAMPVLRNGELLSVFLFLSRTSRPTVDDAMLSYNAALASGILGSALVASGRSTASSLFAYTGVAASQMAAVFQAIVAEGVFSAPIIFQEVDWFFRMGLPANYWETFQPAEIARHVHSFIAAKKLALTTGDPENIWFTLESPDHSSGFFLCNDDHNTMEMIEAKIMKMIEGTPNTKAYTFTSYVSDGPCIPGGSKKLNIAIFDTPKYATDSTDVNEKDLTKIGTELFLRKPKAIRDRYQEIISTNVGKISPTFMTFPEYRDGTTPIMMAFKRGDGSSYLGMITELIEGNKLVCKRKFVETFSNGIVVYSLYLMPTTNVKVQHLLNQISLTAALPRSKLTEFFVQGKITAEEYAYGSSTILYTYYFTNQKQEEVDMLSKTLQGDVLSLNRLKSLANKMKREVVSRRRIIDCITSNIALLQATYAHFAAVTQGATPAKSLEEIQSMVAKAVTNDIDGLIWNSMLTFNKHVLKTNFFSAKKSCLSYRLDPAFFIGTGLNFPAVPYGIFMLVGNEFHGFHVRFEDIARGGVRMIRSGSDQVYSLNFETVFQENYNLAYTQTLKNKEIPEAGSKGTVLLNRANQNNATLAFQKWVSGVLDLMVPKQGVHDLYGKEEIIFLGPDEGTADYMYWAADYARRRNYKYWKAFTTGKPPSLGGVPHDMFGMTTRSVHAYVLGCLRKAGLAEENVTKFQTGGPDGDLGSNEILISKDRTKAMVDGSGVLYDPNGLDRAELSRLAHKRAMVQEFDKSKLSEGGFLVLISDREVTLPNGEFVESGLKFRNEFHLNPLSSADVFVPCGGRPESINLSNIDKMFDDKGKPRFKFIIEGANLFLTNDARMILEKAGVVLYKDASANKGGVTSSSFEVLAALAMSDEEHTKHMCVQGKDFPAFYTEYVKEIQDIIQRNADMEFECIWREHELSGKPRFILTEEVSSKINALNTTIKNSALWQRPDLRKKVLSEALPKTLTKLVPVDTAMQRIPEAYLQAIFGAYLASHFVYKYGISAGEFAFFEFMQSYLANAN